MAGPFLLLSHPAHGPKISKPKSEKKRPAPLKKTKSAGLFSAQIAMTQKARLVYYSIATKTNLGVRSLLELQQVYFALLPNTQSLGVKGHSKAK